jgi:hypothetical protein
MEAKAFSFTHRTKVFAVGTYGRTVRDLRRTDRVPGWHRSQWERASLHAGFRDLIPRPAIPSKGKHSETLAGRS